MILAFREIWFRNLEKAETDYLLNTNGFNTDESMISKKFPSFLHMTLLNINTFIHHISNQKYIILSNYNPMSLQV